MVKKTRVLDEEFEVERIVGKRNEEGVTQYKVKWSGYSSDDCTWEPIEHLAGCQELIDAYNKSHPLPRVAKKCAMNPKRTRTSETLEVEDWNVVEEEENFKPKPKKTLKKPRPGVLGTDRIKAIVRRWREDGDWKAEVSWEDKPSQSLANTEVKLTDLKDKEPKLLVEYLLKELK